MSLVALHVDLPSYSHSFTVEVLSSSTILDVKEAISRTCVGAPRIDGQRIIWRGRYLDDQEKVADIWKSADEIRSVHLAVRPEAWTSRPPEIPGPPATPLPPASPSPSFTSTQSPSPPPQFRPSPVFHPNPYILFKHRKALVSLIDARAISTADFNDLPHWRTLAVQSVERNGWLWPSILDEEPPAVTDDMPSGLIYERVTVDGQPYLTLQNPSATPNAVQIHALRVLTFTFPLLSLPVPNLPSTTTTTPQQVPIPPNVNQLLQQLGLPQLRIVHNQNPIQNGGFLPDLRDIPLRPLLAPFVTMVIRTLLLLYFVSPARKPLFGIIILAWILYEVGWGHIREAFVEGWRLRQPQQQRNPAQGAPMPQPRANGPPVAAGGQQAAQQPPVTPRIPPRIGARSQVEAFLDNMAYINLTPEGEALQARPGVPSEDDPSFAHKVTTFLCLLLVTLHPAVWNRRRVALRQREGRVRTEANVREREPTEEEGEGGIGSSESTLREAAIRAESVAQHARRPRWVKEYVQRVRSGDWVDD